MNPSPLFKQCVAESTGTFALISNRVDAIYTDRLGMGVGNQLAGSAMA